MVLVQPSGVICARSFATEEQTMRDGLSEPGSKMGLGLQQAKGGEKEFQNLMHRKS